MTLLTHTDIPIAAIHLIGKKENGYYDVREKKDMYVTFRFEVFKRASELISFYKRLHKLYIHKKI